MCFSPIRMCLVLDTTGSRSSPRHQPPRITQLWVLSRCVTAPSDRRTKHYFSPSLCRRDPRLLCVKFRTLRLELRNRSLKLWNSGCEFVTSTKLQNRHHRRSPLDHRERLHLAANVSTAPPLLVAAATIAHRTFASAIAAFTLVVREPGPTLAIARLAVTRSLAGLAITHCEVL